MRSSRSNNTQNSEKKRREDFEYSQAVSESTSSASSSQRYSKGNELKMKCPKESFSDVMALPLALSENDDSAMKKLSLDIQNSFVRSVVRFFLFRSGRNEVISRSSISDLLAKLDQSFRKHVAASVYRANEALKSNFGYEVISVNKILGKNLDKTSLNYMIINKMKSPALLSVLSSCNNDAAFRGFTYVVLLILFTSPNRKASVSDILKQIRRLDTRFPDTMIGEESGQDFSGPIPELEKDFTTLLRKMRKVTFTKEHSIYFC
jgi:hypothetical protein